MTEAGPPALASHLVAARIREWRKHRGMTVQALADAITACGYRVERSVLAKQENGLKQTIPIDVVVHSAAVLDVSINALVYGSTCNTCGGHPPAGYSCNACHAGETPPTAAP